MHRRTFVKTTLSAAALGAAGQATALAAPPPEAKHNFKMKYAPHDGMFKNSAGEDFLDQIRFMHDQGFTAIEDNGMSGRDKAQQEKIGDLLEKLGMSMGVFVAHKISWNEANLASGDKDKRAAFLDDIRTAVEEIGRASCRERV